MNSMAKLNKNLEEDKQITSPGVEPDFAKQFMPEILTQFNTPGKLPVTALPNSSTAPKVIKPIINPVTTSTDANTLMSNISKLRIKAGLPTYEGRADLPGIKSKVKIDLNQVKGTKNIVAMQEQLKAAGYDLGDYQGKGGVDGSIGSKTRAAVAAFNAGVSPGKTGMNFKYTKRKIGGEPCIEGQCGEYQNAELIRRSGLSINSEDFKNTLGLNTDAWKMGDAMIKHGGTTIYNANDKIKRNGNPQVGDVVGIHLAGSPFQAQANLEGDKNTHTGFISKIYPNGSYDIEHNVHKGTKGNYEGQAYTSHVGNDRKLQGFNTLYVRRITRPNYSALKGERKDLTTNPDNQLYYNNPAPYAQQAVAFFNKNKEKFANQFGLSEEEVMSLGNASLAAIEQESKYADKLGAETYLKGKELGSELWKRAYAAASPYLTPLLRSTGTGTGSTKITKLISSVKPVEYGKDIEASTGLGRVKHQINFGDTDYRRIFEPKGLGEEAMVDATAVLVSNYKKHKSKGLSNQDALYRAISSYNGGIGEKHSKEGDETSPTWGELKDVDYASKVLVNMQESGAINKGKKYNTWFNKLQLDQKILKNAANIKSVYSSLKSGGRLISKHKEGEKLSLHAEPKRDWLVDWTKRNFPKVSNLGEAMGAIPMGVNPIKVAQTAGDLTGVPGLVNAVAGNPMNLPSNEVESAMIPIAGGVKNLAVNAENIILPKIVRSTKTATPLITGRTSLLPEITPLITKTTPLITAPLMGFKELVKNFKNINLLKNLVRDPVDDEIMERIAKQMKGELPLTLAKSNLLIKSGASKQASEIPKIFQIKKSVNMPKEYGVNYTVINSKNLNPILQRMKTNNDGSFVKKTLFEDPEAYLTKGVQDFEADLPALTSKLHYKKGFQGIIPQHQSLIISPVGSTSAENMQVQKFSPGSFLYKSNYSNLNQKSIDEAKRTIEGAYKEGLRFDMKGGNNSLYDAANNRFNFIDTGIEERFYNNMDPIEAFTKHLIKGVEHSVSKSNVMRLPGGAVMLDKPIPGSGLAWLKQRGLTAVGAGVAAGLGTKGIQERKSGGRLIPKKQTGSTIDTTGFHNKSIGLLKQYKDLNFVNRALNASQPNALKYTFGKDTPEFKQGETSGSHKMSYVGDDKEGYFAFPTIYQNKGENKLTYNPDAISAWKVNQKNNEFIPLGNDKNFAEYFTSTGYKNNFPADVKQEAATNYRKLIFKKQKGDRLTYNRINPGLSFVDLPIAMMLGDVKDTPRTEDNKATPEEEAYFKRYLNLPSKLPTSNYRTAWDKNKNNEFVGVYPSMEARIQAIGDTLNTGKIFRNYDAYKKLQPGLPDKDTIEETYTFGKKLLNNPGKWQQAKEDMSLKASPKGTTGLGAFRNFGMMWDKNKGNINVHDTYDFPLLTRPLIPGRDTALQIRDAIPFNPLKGSKLLRNKLGNYNSIK